MELLDLIKDLENRKDNAKQVVEREKQEGGNQLSRYDNWGRYVAYSHCLKHLQVIYKEQTEVNTCVIADVSKRFIVTAVELADFNLCAVGDMETNRVVCHVNVYDSFKEAD